MSNGTIAGKDDPVAGELITAKQAQDYMDMQQKLKKNLKTSVLATQSSTLEVDTKKYFDSEVNAFLFSEETFNRFFPADGSPKAEYLLVIMGAKHEGDDKGEPTVVLAGVTKDGDDTYYSLDIPFPGTEQPPRKTIAKFPETGSKGRIKFTIV